MTPMAPRMRSCESRNGATTIEQPVLANKGLSAPMKICTPEATLASSSRRIKLSARFLDGAADQPGIQVVGRFDQCRRRHADRRVDHAVLDMARLGDGHHQRA